MKGASFPLATNGVGLLLVWSVPDPHKVEVVRGGLSALREADASVV